MKPSTKVQIAAWINIAGFALSFTGIGFALGLILSR